MATKRSVPKVSKRSTRATANQTRRSNDSQRAAPEPEPAHQRHEVEPEPSALDSVPSLAERIEAERQQLFKALSIVECCKNASATLFEVIDSEYMVPAFDAVCDLLNVSAGELERIASECESSTEPARRCD